MEKTKFLKIFFVLIYNLTYRRTFTCKVWTDDIKLLQESNLTARQPHRAPHHVIHASASEGLVQGPYVAASLRFEPACDLPHQRYRIHHWVTTPL